ncbi:phosphoenolpyruvate--protein phosphotransferase, partial [Pseudomonas sp. FW305-130]
IDLAHGIHARPAARIAACARAFSASITLGKGARTASALSPTGLLALGIGHGDTITLAAQGSDGTAALDALVALISGGMDEAPAPAAPPP